MENFPMRAWSVRMYLLDEDGKEIPATIFEKATYKLHPSFAKPNQTFKSPPFEIKEEGWGEFDMEIILTAVEKGGDYPIKHDLNFQSEMYESQHVLTFKNPKPAFMQVLKDTGGSIQGDDTNGVIKQKRGASKLNSEGAEGGATESAKKRKRGTQTIDMERLADGLQKLHADDLLEVIKIVHDNKTSETYTKNDPELGEFHVDLYTLPDSCLRMLWDYTVSKVDA
ncbi:MAG: hypothetical protein M1816_007104 [Peltula sp. TS41687]|nr:MAG: hypothetical protein M1816_007104 [Peltula sp. TS41687]